MSDVRRCAGWAKKHYIKEPFRRAAFLCCSLIAHHPFHDGNHRTSLEAAILQLMFEGYFYRGTTEHEKELYNWRYDYEELHQLEARWAYELGGWDNPRGAEAYMLRFMEDEYAKKIEEYLRQHCVQMAISDFIAELPPSVFCRIIRRYPAPYQKVIRRKRRARAARLRKIWIQMERQFAHEEMREVKGAVQKPWRDD